MKFKYSGNLNKDIFENFSQILTDFRIEELEVLVDQTLDVNTKSNIAKDLIKRTKEYYKNGKNFKNMTNENQVRDHLIIFGRHFLSKICQDNYKYLYEKIPVSFRLGLYHPKPQDNQLTMKGL